VEGRARAAGRPGISADVGTRASGSGCGRRSAEVKRSESHPVVSLREVVQEMDLPGDEWTAYLDTRTGELVSVSDEDARATELDEEEQLALPDWQRDSLPKVREVLESEHYVPLPTKSEIHEWAIIEGFSSAVLDPELRHRLLDAIHGSGAFRRFRDLVRAEGIEAEWYRYRERALEEIAVEWLESRGIAYTRGPEASEGGDAQLPRGPSAE
jgi:hypothetical protein